MSKVVYSHADATVVALKYNADIANAMWHIMKFYNHLECNDPLSQEDHELRRLLNMRLFNQEIPVAIGYDAAYALSLFCTRSDVAWTLAEIFECLHYG